jgi:hypothetical protein
MQSVSELRVRQERRNCERVGMEDKLVASRSRWCHCTPCLQGLARFWLLEKFREHCASCLIKTTVASTDLTCLALAVHAETMVDIVGKSGALNRCHRFSI